MKRIFGNNLHWQGKGWHAGVHRDGGCWRFSFHRTEYATCTFYGFWKLFISIDK